MKQGVIISFTGVGYQLGGIQTEEFRKIKSFKNYDNLFFIDKSKSWFNNVDTDEIIEKIKMYDNVITLGNSMGAFSAIMFAKYYPVKKAIAFATQYSLHPDIVPWEERWNGYQKIISEKYGWKNKHLEFNDKTKYYIISGNDKEDKKHIDMIPKKSNIKKIVIQGANHGVAKYLKEQNKLYPLIEEIINDA